MVTGPSLVKDTCIWAPKTPLATRPRSARAAATNTSNKRRPKSGVAAVEKPGRSPLAVSAASVNCGTSSNSPPISVRLKFIFPAASGKTRYCSRRLSSRRAEASSSLGTIPTKTSKPTPMRPTCLSSIRTSAWETRCNKPIIKERNTTFLIFLWHSCYLYSTFCYYSEIWRSGTRDPLFSPQSGGKQHQNGENLQASEQHRRGTHPGLKIIQHPIVAARAHQPQARTCVVDAGNNGRKRGHEIQAARQLQENQRDDAHEIKEHERQHGEYHPVGNDGSAHLERPHHVGMHQLVQFAVRLLGKHQRADHLDAAAGGSGACDDAAQE